VELMGIDINERVFKVLGSGGVAVTDSVAAYREWFTEDELVVPKSVDDFHDMVRLLLSEPNMRETFSHRGALAVEERHTYFHRARRVLALLGVSWPIAD
jgi:spore maturation protein CgeB